MASKSEVELWQKSLINGRTKRVFTPIENPQDIEREANLLKTCLRCNPDKPVLAHKVFTMQKVKDEDGNTTGIYRNNNCKKCESRSPLSKSSNEEKIASMEKDISFLKESMMTILDHLPASYESSKKKDSQKQSKVSPTKSR